ncbi:MAG: 4Fe-4S binding protein [Planctomycetes bacterium]|nr:4Fe-4S binding protein [Planctomycetota bacterium]
MRGLGREEDPVGHAAEPHAAHARLQRRLDRMVTGAPASPVFFEILRILYSREDAQIAARLPARPTTIEKLSARLSLPPEPLEARLTDMAHRGLVFDLEMGGRRYFALAPVAIGFFELTFMRAREELPMRELAGLFEAYLGGDDRFARAVFSGRTQIGRSLVREEALPDADHTEILDWERASRIIESASAVALSLCACRHMASHLGKACDRPVDCCISLGMAAESLVRNGLARRVTAREGLRILEAAKAAGLAQTADNVRREPAYICNCCGCCCGMMMAIRRFDLRHAIVTSGWIAEIDRTACKGCGLCERACPAGAIVLREVEEDGATRRVAGRDETLCLGCGVCASACKAGAIRMRRRLPAVHVPETLYERTIAMAIERGKLADLIFDAPESIGGRALRAIASTIERLPPIKAALAIRPIRSAFLKALVKGAPDLGAAAETSGRR